MANGDPTVNTPLLRALVGLGTGPGLPDVGQGLTLLDLLQNPLNRDDLLAQATAPTEFRDPVEAERISPLRALGLALASAGSAYAAGINPSVQAQNFLQRAQALREFRAERATERQREQDIERGEAGRERARLELGTLEQQQRRKDIRREREEDILRADVRRRQDITREEELFERERRSRLEDIAIGLSAFMEGDPTKMETPQLISAIQAAERKRLASEGIDDDRRTEFEVMAGDQFRAFFPTIEDLVKRGVPADQILAEFDRLLVGIPLSRLFKDDLNRRIEAEIGRLTAGQETTGDRGGVISRLGAATRRGFSAEDTSGETLASALGLAAPRDPNRQGVLTQQGEQDLLRLLLGAGRFSPVAGGGI